LTALRGPEVPRDPLVRELLEARWDDAVPLVEFVHGRYVAEAGLTLPGVAECLEGDDVAVVLEVESATTWDERANPATAELRASGGALLLVTTSPRESIAAGDPG
jgi:hypothetical protein